MKPAVFARLSIMMLLQYFTWSAWYVTMSTYMKVNLAASDAQILARAITAFYKSNRDDLLDQYSTTALRRIWKATRFSWWFTSMMHSFPGADEFQHRLQIAELDYVTGSKAGATALAENYVGLAIE